MTINIRNKVEKYGYKMHRFIPNKLAILRNDDGGIHVSVKYGVRVGKDKKSLSFEEIAMINQVIKELKR